MGARGQAYTLEAFIAALLLVASLTFALQVTAVTPLSESTSNQHIQNQHRTSATGALAAVDEAGALDEAVLYWNTTEESFHDPNYRNHYTDKYPDNDFGDVLNRSFADRGLAVNVLVHYETGDDSESTQEMVYNGEPSDNAAASSRTVTLYDDDPILDENLDEDAPLEDREEAFYANDEHVGPAYNVVRVEVIVWRM